MVCEVQAATDENLYLTFLVSQSGTHETQAPGFHLVQELHYFMFMKLRPQVLNLCKHFTISLSCIFMKLRPSFPCTQICSNRCKYIQIYSNRLSTNPDAHLANGRERCWRQHRNKVKTARPGE